MGVRITYDTIHMNAAPQATIKYIADAAKAAQVVYHGFIGDGLRTAAAEMRSVYERAARGSRPLAHLVVSWAKGEDQPLPDDALRIARRVLKKIGLDDHQWVAAAHADSQYRHVHILVNRVDPRTGELRGKEFLGYTFDELRDELETEFPTMSGPLQTHAPSAGANDAETWNGQISAQRWLRDYLRSQRIGTLADLDAALARRRFERVPHKGGFLFVDSDHPGGPLRLRASKCGFGPDRMKALGSGDRDSAAIAAEDTYEAFLEREESLTPFAKNHPELAAWRRAKARGESVGQLGYYLRRGPRAGSNRQRRIDVSLDFAEISLDDALAMFSREDVSLTDLRTHTLITERQGETLMADGTPSAPLTDLVALRKALVDRVDFLRALYETSIDGHERMRLQAEGETAKKINAQLAELQKSGITTIALPAGAFVPAAGDAGATLVYSQITQSVKDAQAVQREAQAAAEQPPQPAMHPKLAARMLQPYKIDDLIAALKTDVVYGSPESTGIDKLAALKAANFEEIELRAPAVERDADGKLVVKSVAAILEQIAEHEARHPQTFTIDDLLKQIDTNVNLNNGVIANTSDANMERKANADLERWRDVLTALREDGVEQVTFPLNTIITNPATEKSLLSYHFRDSQYERALVDATRKAAQEQKAENVVAAPDNSQEPNVVGAPQEKTDAGGVIRAPKEKARTTRRQAPQRGLTNGNRNTNASLETMLEGWRAAMIADGVDPLAAHHFMNSEKQRVELRAQIRSHGTLDQTDPKRDRASSLKLLREYGEAMTNAAIYEEALTAFTGKRALTFDSYLKAQMLNHTLTSEQAQQIIGWDADRLGEMPLRCQDGWLSRLEISPRTIEQNGKPVLDGWTYAERNGGPLFIEKNDGDFYLTPLAERHSIDMALITMAARHGGVVHLEGSKSFLKTAVARAAALGITVENDDLREMYLKARTVAHQERQEFSKPRPPVNAPREVERVIASTVLRADERSAGDLLTHAKESGHDKVQMEIRDVVNVADRRFVLAQALNEGDTAEYTVADVSEYQQIKLNKGDRIVMSLDNDRLILDAHESRTAAADGERPGKRGRQDRGDSQSNDIDAEAREALRHLQRGTSMENV